jgi:hypothetical protein
VGHRSKVRSSIRQAQGRHNLDLDGSIARLTKGQSYRNLSTIIVTPIPGDPAMLPAKVYFDSWANLMTPMNQQVYRLPILNMEVGDAYNKAIDAILSNPQLSKFKYVLTLEHDNLPPPDGLLRLYESMDKFDVVGGLYWTKGELGQPMIYGDPKVFPKGFAPQKPIPETVQECNGLGMGFTLFKLSIFNKVPKPWFKTMQEYNPSEGTKAATQDLYFFQNAAKEGFRFACDTRVRVGHLNVADGTVW